SLVEQTAEYLDGRGRSEARRLTPPASFAFTAESMKLTTRLMQLASWLLLRRAVANGELTIEDANKHKRRVRLTPQSQVTPDGFDGLPETLKHLIEESCKLYDRILRLDHVTDRTSNEEEPAQPPLDTHIKQIRLAFSAA